MTAGDDDRNDRIIRANSSSADRIQRRRRADRTAQRSAAALRQPDTRNRERWTPTLATAQYRYQRDYYRRWLAQQALERHSRYDY